MQIDISPTILYLLSSYNKRRIPNFWPWPDREKGSTNGSSILDMLGRHVPSSNLLQFAIGHGHLEIVDLPINNINSMVMFQFVM